MTNSVLPQSASESVPMETQHMHDLRKRLGPWLKPKILVGGTFVLLLCFMGVFSPWISPHDPNAQNLLNTLQPPGWWAGENFLGTDHVGRDILSRIFFGARISLIIAITVVLISGVVGVALGAISGFSRVISILAFRNWSRWFGPFRHCFSQSRSLPSLDKV